MKKTIKKTKKIPALERIADSLESIALSFKNNDSLNKLVDKQIELKKLEESEYWTITDSASESTYQILGKARSLFSVYCYDEKNLDTQFPAPKKDIIVSFKKNIEPDQEHRNKSYEDFMNEAGKNFMDFRQYLLLCIHVWETERQHLDVMGWTRTSSLWSDGGLVRGGWGGGACRRRCGR